MEFNEYTNLPRTYLFRSKSKPSSTSSFQPVVERCTINDRCMLNHSTLEHGHSNQDSLRSTAQAFLECLDRHDHHSRLNSAIDRITRICLAEILASCQPEVEDPLKYSNIDLQAISGVKLQTPVAHNEVIHPSSTDPPLLPQLSALQHLQGQLPGQGSGFLSQGSVGVTSTLPEGINPPPEQRFPGRVSCINRLSFVYHVRLDFFPFGTSYPVSYEPSARPLHSSVHHYSTYAEGQAFSGPSTSHHQEPHLHVTRGSQEKVKCGWTGCSSVIKKDSLTRHVTEIHLRKVKHTCDRCGRAFMRTYDKKNHEPTCRGRQFGG